MTIVKATAEKRSAIISLLQSQSLPADDLPPALPDFYVAEDGDLVVGLIGMERYGNHGLLRSMVVAPDYRNRQIAEKLVQVLEEEARSYGIFSIYLLTETAEKYFDRKGYTKISRTNVPAEVMLSSEFSHVCPVSATVMKKDLTTASVPLLS